jgi:hypothetical protein
MTPPAMAVFIRQFLGWPYQPPAGDQTCFGYLDARQLRGRGCQLGATHGTRPVRIHSPFMGSFSRFRRRRSSSIGSIVVCEGRAEDEGVVELS